MAQFPTGGPLHLFRAVAWIDDVAAVHHQDDLLDPEFTASADGHGSAGAAIGAVILDDGDTHSLSARQVGLEARNLLQFGEDTLPRLHALRHLQPPFERIPAAG